MNQNQLLLTRLTCALCSYGARRPPFRVFSAPKATCDAGFPITSQGLCPTVVFTAGDQPRRGFGPCCSPSLHRGHNSVRCSQPRALHFRVSRLACSQALLPRGFGSNFHPLLTAYTHGSPLGMASNLARCRLAGAKIGSGPMLKMTVIASY